MKSTEVIRRLTADGWVLCRTKGSHHHFNHPSKPGLVTVPHPKKDIPIGTLKSIERQSGVKHDLKTMHYFAIISREGRHVLAEFPDCPGCQTFDTADGIADAAREALEGWLEAHLALGNAPPRPIAHTTSPANTKLARIAVRAGLAAALQVRWARQDAGLTQGALGKKARVTQQQIAKLENPDLNPSLETLEKAARALGLDLTVTLEQPFSVATPERSSKRRVASQRIR
jgi:predicted RNA binding protein YcfA (HicA-like mRNA interferase family)/DNA-binding XRE family transcriptional regulator